MNVFDTTDFNSETYDEIRDLWNSEFIQASLSLLSKYSDNLDDMGIDLNSKELEKAFYDLLHARVEERVNEYLEFMEHDPNKHCELLLLSKEELSSYNLLPDSKNYFHLYIDGEKVNDNIYSFDTYTFNEIRDNKKLNEARFAIIKKYEVDYSHDISDGSSYLKDGERVVIDTRTGKELLVPLKMFSYQTFSKNSNFVILTKDYSKRAFFMFLPTCIFILGNKKIESYWETETHYYIRCDKEKSSDFDEIYKIDKETAQYERI